MRNLGLSPVGTAVWIVGLAIIALKDMILPLLGLPTEGTPMWVCYGIGAAIFLIGALITAFGSKKRY